MATALAEVEFGRAISNVCCTESRARPIGARADLCSRRSDTTRVLYSTTPIRIAVIVDVLGAVKYEKLYALYKRVADLLGAEGNVLVEPGRDGCRSPNGRSASESGPRPAPRSEQPRSSRSECTLARTCCHRDFGQGQRARTNRDGSARVTARRSGKVPRVKSAQLYTVPVGGNPLKRGRTRRSPTQNESSSNVFGVLQSIFGLSR